MHSLLSLSLLAGAYAQTQINIGSDNQQKRLDMRSALETLDVSGSMEDLMDEFDAHGCFCARFSDNTVDGKHPVDDLDELCKQWMMMRRCSDLSGACSNDTAVVYGVSNGACEQNAQDDACAHQTCLIDLHFIAAIVQDVLQNGLPGRHCDEGPHRFWREDPPFPPMNHTTTDTPPTTKSAEELCAVVEYPTGPALIPINNPVCVGKVDITLIIDASGSVGYNNFVKTKTFVKWLMDHANYLNANNRFAAVKYDGWYIPGTWRCCQGREVIEFSFESPAAISNYWNTAIQSFDTKGHADEYTAEIKAKITAMRYTSGGTMTGSAMMKGRDVMNASTGRHTVKQLMMVITDGVSYDSPIPARTLLNDEGVTVYAIGVGRGISYKGLYDTSGFHNHVLQIDNFEELEKMADTQLADKTTLSKIQHLEGRICGNSLTLATPARTCLVLKQIPTAVIGWAGSSSSAKWEFLDGNGDVAHEKVIKNGLSYSYCTELDVIVENLRVTAIGNDGWAFYAPKVEQLGVTSKFYHKTAAAKNYSFAQVLDGNNDADGRFSVQGCVNSNACTFDKDPDASLIQPTSETPYQYRAQADYS